MLKNKLKFFSSLATLCSSIPLIMVSCHSQIQIPNTEIVTNTLLLNAYKEKDKENNLDINLIPSFKDNWYNNTVFQLQSNVGIIRNLEDFEKFSNGINPPQNWSEDILKGFMTNKTNWKIFYENEIFKHNFFDKNDLLYAIKNPSSITGDDIIDSIEIEKNIITLNYIDRYSIWELDYGMLIPVPAIVPQPFSQFIIIPKLQGTDFVFETNTADRLEKYNTLRNKMPLGKYYSINE